MADYISREVAIKEINNMYEYEFPTASGPLDEFFVKFVPATLRAIPAVDVVEVVRCKGCKYRRKNDENEPYCVAKDGLLHPSDDEFCSYGKRKEQTKE